MNDLNGSPGPWALGTLLALALSGFNPEATQAQTRSVFVMSGYGTITYEAATTGDFPNDFSASLSPVFLYSMGDDFLFEAELEFGLNGVATTTSLEYAQIDYLGFESFQIIAGKFLLPFGTFSERIHPSWINKLPTGPVLYGHAHGGVAEDGLLPVLSDAGVQLRFTHPFSSTWSLDITGFVTQGPSLGEVDDHDDGEEEDDHGEEEEDDHGEETPAPAVAFGTSFGDNNSNKMVGARVGLVKGPAFEVYLSGFHALYDSEGLLDYRAAALSVEWRRSGFEFRGEGLLTRQEFQREDRFVDQSRSGFYAQVSKRVGKWEPVVRWGSLADATVDTEAVIDGHNEIAMGLAYWFQPSIPLKLSWEIHEDRDDRLYVQWAFGF
ncbi:MAG: hypothetical protein HKO98_11375 [Gemmatimonadetes bacterium]|nr:hypothetical protein [Gemmatimonadota bacterium]